MTTYQCIGGPLDGLRYRADPKTFDVSTLERYPMPTPNGTAWYVFDHRNERIVWDRMYAADAIKAERST